MARICAAAHGKGLCIRAHHLVVGAHQRLNGRCIRIDIEGLVFTHRLKASARRFGQPRERRAHGVCIDAGGEADVDALP